MQKASGGLWRCAFSDDFSGDGLDSTKWAPLTTEVTGGMMTECRIDSPDNIVVRDGTLRLTVRKEATPIRCGAPGKRYTTSYTAGAVSTGKKFSLTYGRVEIRAKFPDAKVAGLHSAIWMWPLTMRYGHLSGEIDIAEYRTAAPDRVVPTLHYEDDGTASRKTRWNCLVDQPDQFHTYAVEWTATTIRFSYDGETCFTHNWKPAAPLRNPAPFDEPYFIILNQSISNTFGGNAFDPENTPLPATMEVDYVRVWR